MKISDFSRNEFYNGEALKDANTIKERNEKYPFEYRKGRKRSVWLDVASTINSGVNTKGDCSNQRNFARFYRLGSSKSSSKKQ